jgi:hypothetical protein
MKTPWHSKRLAVEVILATALLAGARSVRAQGCIAVRGGGQCSAGAFMDAGHDEGYLEAGGWQVSTGYRWIESDRHFSGSTEFTVPRERNAEVISKQHFVDVAVQRAISRQFSLGLTIPLSYSTRSTTYEHDNINRYETSSSGLGDIRLAAYYWVFDPEEALSGNVWLAFGPKFPTGEYDAEDTFYTSDGPVRAAVDQSIQPGDGGYGFALEVFCFRRLVSDLNGYLQGSYLFNPENENGVSTTTGERFGNPFEQTMSIPDQYLGRAGLSYALEAEHGLSVSLGARIEGVPKKDAIGDNDGFRRPGYAVSIEPGVSLMKNGWNFGLTVPVALYRNRVRSVADERLFDFRGEYHHGDAAFADYVITANLSRQF